METLFWQTLTRSPETEFIFELFHFLLAALGLIVVVRLRRRDLQHSLTGTGGLLGAFLLFAVASAVRSLASGGVFFLAKPWAGFGVTATHHAFFLPACLLSAFGLTGAVRCGRERRVYGSALAVGLVIGLLLVVHRLRSTDFRQTILGNHTAGLLLADAAAVAGTLFGVFVLIRRRRRFLDTPTLALLLLCLALAIHTGRVAWSGTWADPVWHLEQHVLSLSLFALVWTLGERITGLFDKVFVRLNLTLIILASVTILSTVGMQRFQYIKLAEERSLSLAEYVRGHLIYYHGRGDDLDTILGYPGVMRRLVVAFGEIPDFRRLDIRLEGERATFRYAADRTITQEVEQAPALGYRDSAVRLYDPVLRRTLFRMLNLALDSGVKGEVALYGTFESINRHIGNYIILIYLLFTVMAVAGITMVGIIVHTADREIQRQHEEIERVQQQLAQASKLASIGELAGGVAHEINNPVTSILSTATHMVEKLRQGRLSSRDARQLERITKEAKRISGIVYKLLTFSRRSRMELHPVDINEIVCIAIGLIEFRLRNGKTVLKRHLAESLPRFFGDAERLVEVLVNLMNNALDAMPDGGTLTIRTRKAGAGSIQVEVADTGTGIPSDVIDRIFDPFFTTKGPGKGTGLGLSISHGIIKEHGGEIRVTSTPGAGSTFVISLPVNGTDYEESSGE